VRRLSLLLVVAAAGYAAAGAGAAPKTLGSYCSSSGDVCYGIVRSGGTVYLRITTFARYFSRYRLCVRSPGGGLACRTFPIRPAGSLFGSRVVWYAHFPRRGPGRYKVTWRLGERRLGPPLTFRIRPRVIIG
jgi:hypothetical protein